jgi:hypothetical protein
MTIRADLIGSNRASAAGITVNGHAPVCRLCRALIRAGHDPATPLEAFRGATLCLRVRSIGEGADLTVRESTADGKPRFIRYRTPFPMAGSLQSVCAPRSKVPTCLPARCPVNRLPCGARS